MIHNLYMIPFLSSLLEYYPYISFISLFLYSEGDHLVSCDITYMVMWTLFNICAFSMKRSRKFQPEDRLFSLSSVTSPAVCIGGSISEMLTIPNYITLIITSFHWMWAPLCTMTSNFANSTDIISTYCTKLEIHVSFKFG